MRRRRAARVRAWHRRHGPIGRALRGALGPCSLGATPAASRSSRSLAAIANGARPDVGRADEILRRRAGCGDRLGRCASRGERPARCVDVARGAQSHGDDGRARRRARRASRRAAHRALEQRRPSTPPRGPQRPRLASRMRAASTAALRALSTPTQATGTPGGIWAIESSASSPPATDFERRQRHADDRQRRCGRRPRPGSAADRPAPAMITRRPRILRVLGVVGDRVGVAVGGHHAHLVADAALLELLRRPSPSRPCRSWSP